MQENIRQYKRMELEADLLEKRVSALQNIADMYRSYLEEKQRLQIQSYLIDRARLQIILEEKKALNEELDRLEKEIADYSQKQADIVVKLVNERKKETNSSLQNKGPTFIRKWSGWSYRKKNFLK